MNALEEEAARLGKEAAEQADAEAVEIGRFILAGGEVRRGNLNREFWVAYTKHGHDGCDRSPLVAVRMAADSELEARARQAQIDAKAPREFPEPSGLEDPF
jgi:hypothetical protein